MEKQAEKMIKQFDLLGMNLYQARRCAEIAVDEKISSIAKIQEKFGVDNIEVVREITQESRRLVKLKTAITNFEINNGES